MNEYKENENSDYTSLRPVHTTSGKIAKVYLSPFSLSIPKLFKSSRSPFENNSNNAGSPKKTGRKKTCREVLTSKMKTVSSKAESLLLKLPSDARTESTRLEPKNTAEPVALSVNMASSDEDSSPGLVRVVSSSNLISL